MGKIYFQIFSVNDEVTEGPSRSSADAGKARIAGLADRWATWVVVIALSAAGITWLVTGEIIRSVTILAVFCPCSMVLATPTAIMAAIGNATRHGFLVREEGPDMIGRVKALGVSPVLSVFPIPCFLPVSLRGFNRSRHRIPVRTTEEIEMKIKKITGIIITGAAAVMLLASCTATPDAIGKKAAEIEKRTEVRVKDGNDAVADTGSNMKGASGYLRSSVWEDEKGIYRAVFDEAAMPESPPGFTTEKKSESELSVIYVTSREMTLIGGGTERTVMTSLFELMDEDTVLASFTVETTGEPTVSGSAVLMRK